jgi:hypothetical protein
VGGAHPTHFLQRFLFLLPLGRRGRRRDYQFVCKWCSFDAEFPVKLGLVVLLRTIFLDIAIERFDKFYNSGRLISHPVFPSIKK